jgi:hypothetical protein
MRDDEVDLEVLERIAEELERTKDDPFPEGAMFTRPNRDRSRVYSIRLNPDEYDAVQRVAEAAHLPPSTLVRSWILQRLESEPAARPSPS